MSALTLVIGNKNYSSWSMRAWLLLRWLEVDFEEIVIPLYRPGSRAAVLPYSPTGLLPALVDGELHIWDSFAIILHLADRFPHVWPAEPARRAFVRSACAEMHSGFQALRTAMPHNGRARDRRVPRTAALDADIARIFEIWTEGRRRFGADGPWLAGAFGIGDIVFAPVASRFRTYGVTLDAPAADYAAALLGHPLVLRWFAEGADEPEVVADAEIGLG
ncbi:MAG TPA: glutathione S-transferase family protein [Allosphingosinicella sp.]|nr:glutathione S-transferase family protein [Allosphingosinicella sp.]